MQTLDLIVGSVEGGRYRFRTVPSDRFTWNAVER